LIARLLKLLLLGGEVLDDLLDRRSLGRGFVEWTLLRTRHLRDHDHKQHNYRQQGTPRAQGQGQGSRTEAHRLHSNERGDGRVTAASTPKAAVHAAFREGVGDCGSACLVRCNRRCQVCRIYLSLLSRSMPGELYQALQFAGPLTLITHGFG
jgi:hypothetical protein